MRRLHRYIQGKSLRLLLVLALAVGLGMSLGVKPVSACGEPSNDIMLCGFSSPRNFANTANGEQKHIYSAYGLEPAEYDKFVAKSVQGWAYKDNTLRLNNNTIVAHDVDSIGRNRDFQKPDTASFFSQTIDGKKYYGNTNDKAFASGPLPATILLDAQGKVQFAVLNDCGNPIGAPNYRCNTLHMNQVAGQPNVFKFSSDVTANSTAKVKRVVYDFGDGHTDTETDPSVVVTHTYDERDASYQAKVTVYISLPHASDVVIQAGGDCVKKVVVNIPPKPSYTCVNLSRDALDDSSFRYRFTAKGTAAHGATIHSATFKFGDGSSQTKLADKGSNTISINHSYDANKKAIYEASVTLNIDLPGNKTDTVSSSDCKNVKVPVKTPFYACKTFGGSLVDEAAHKYSFTVVADYNKFVTFTNAQFDFGDGSAKVTVNKGKDGHTETTTHTYTALQDYTVTTVLNFKITDEHNKVVKASCTTQVTPTGVISCQPGDVTSPTGQLCHPCTTNPAVPVGSPECTLPNTGAGQVIGITGVAAVLGFFLYRQFIYRKRLAPNAGGAVAMHGHTPPDDDDNEVAAQVITHQTAHRNSKGLHHASYHKPHRFRPRTHKKD